MEIARHIWDSKIGDENYDDFFDLDDDGYIGLFDIMKIVKEWNAEN